MCNAKVVDLTFGLAFYLSMDYSKNKRKEVRERGRRRKGGRERDRQTDREICAPYHNRDCSLNLLPLLKEFSFKLLYI